jgi:hypothetical protein
LFLTLSDSKKNLPKTIQNSKTLASLLDGFHCELVVDMLSQSVSDEAKHKAKKAKVVMSASHYEIVTERSALKRLRKILLKKDTTVVGVDIEGEHLSRRGKICLIQVWHQAVYRTCRSCTLILDH